MGKRLMNNLLKLLFIHLSIIHQFKAILKHIIQSIILLLIYAYPVYSQTDSSVWAQKPELTYSGYVDVFYAYDFNTPQTNHRQPFLYNHNRHSEFNLNLGIIKASIKHAKYRANIALHTGSYVMDNYAYEPTALQHISEANAGISLNKKNNLWIDAGIIGSHIGFESAISKDCWTLTRSLLAENSPYYLSGAKLTYSPNKYWEWTALVCNGWQRIQKITGNSLPSFGTQIKYTKNDKLLINWSTFIGTDDPDTSRRMRYFNNLYVQSQLTKRLGVLGGFDIGTQQRIKGSDEYNIWFSPVIIIRYMLTSKWYSALRAELYQDKKGVIISTLSTIGFTTKGLSLNIDYLPGKNIACRVEGRWLGNSDKIFLMDNKSVSQNYVIASSIAITF